MTTVMRSTTLVALAVATAIVMPATAGADGCGWQPAVLPLPPGDVEGSAKAADGEWLAGYSVGGHGAQDPTQAVLWRGGQVQPLGRAFGLNTTVTGVSPAGAVVGIIREGNRSHAVRYLGGSWYRLPESGSASSADDINEGGDAVGLQDVAGGPTQLVVWSLDGTGAVRELAVPDTDSPFGSPRIDDDGTVVARTSASPAQVRSYVWAPDGTRTRLRPVIANGDVHVLDIRGGRIVGYATGPGGFIAAEWDTAGGLVRTFPGREVATAVNRNGWVLGYTVQGRPVVWLGDGAAEELPMPGGYDFGFVYAINDAQVGGLAVDSGNAAAPVRWERSCN